MTISDYKQATVRLNEFIEWSRKNYTENPIYKKRRKLVGDIRMFRELGKALAGLSCALKKLKRHEPEKS